MTTEYDETMIGETLDDLVVRGSDDWLMLTELDWLVKTNTARHGLNLDAVARIMVGVEVLRRVLERGLMVAGDVVKEPPGFISWDVDQAAALDRIDKGWRSAGPNLQMGDVCWLANTADGNRHADTVLDAVNARANWRPGGDRA